MLLLFCLTIAEDAQMVTIYGKKLNSRKMNLVIWFHMTRMSLKVRLNLEPGHCASENLNSGFASGIYRFVGKTALS